MKRKIKKFSEGDRVYDKEDEGLLGAKINYREEDGRKYTAGKANPFDRNPQEQRYYSVDDIKGKLSGLFGGSSEDSKSFSKFKDLESVGGAGRSPRTIEEQIGRKAEPKAEPKAETKTNGVDFSKFDTKSYTDKPVGGGNTSITSPEADKKAAAPKANKKAAAPKAAAPKADVPIGADVKPAPAKPSDKKEEPKPLPGKSEESSNYISPKKIQEERRRIVMEKRERTKSPEFPSKEDKFPLKSLLKEDKPKESSNYISPKKIQEERSRIAMKKRENDKSALENRKEYGMKKGGSVSSASSRGDGIAARGKTRGKIC